MIEIQAIHTLNKSLILKKSLHEIRSELDISFFLSNEIRDTLTKNFKENERVKLVSTVEDII